MAKVKVHNGQARLLTVVLGLREGETVGRMIDLVPGMNEVDADALEQAKKHPEFRQWGQLGWITVGASPAPVAAVDEDGNDDGENDSPVLPENLSKLKAAEAIELVATVDDTDALERWLGVEDRATVTKAIAERIEQIEAADAQG